MFKFRFILILSILILLALPSAAHDIDVSGDWELSMLTPRGEITTNINFVQECDKITVTVTRRNGGEYTGEGTIKGNAIEWTITRNTPSGEITITYTGTVEGDTMSGEATVGDSGTREWTANKK